MIKKYTRGFTLIELLVVIAIIGILSSIVLVSLSTARGKGKAASAVGSMTSMRAAAELGVDSSGKYLTALCTTNASVSTGGLAELLAAANAQAGAGKATCFGDETNHTAWAAQVDLTGVGNTGSNSYFCVDSTGYAGYLAASSVGAADFKCN